MKDIRPLNEYNGHWLTTFTGGRVHYLDPKPDEINIVDIAHALALTCRFGGHIRAFYSVAQHSILVADLVDKDLKLSALLHDAHEAYLHDVPRPIKQDISGYKEIADRLQKAINKKFNLVNSAAIKYADNVLLATEARDLMPNTTDWAELPAPADYWIDPWTWEDAEHSFLDCFKIYGGCG